MVQLQNPATASIAKSATSSPENGAGELTRSGKGIVRKAVQIEKRRLAGKKNRKLADTELGKSVQDTLGAPAVLINRYVKQAATEVLKKSSPVGRKQ